MNAQKPEFLTANPQNRAGCGLNTIFLVVVIVVIAFVLLLTVGKILIVDRAQPAVATQSPIPTSSPRPTMPCIEPTLILGKTHFRIETAASSEGGVLPEPPREAGTALWVEGSSPNYLLVLNPDPTNQQMLTALPLGAVVTITWADCSRDEFVLKDVIERTALHVDDLDQTRGSVTVYLPLDASGRGLVLSSGRPEQPTPSSKETEPASTGLQANIAFLETIPSADGQTMTLVIEVKNTGAASIHLAAEDFSLSPDGAPDQVPVSVEPALPLEIPQGETRRLTLVFPHPGGSAALFRLQDFIADLYY
jgi:hypothetical protein